MKYLHKGKDFPHDDNADAVEVVAVEFFNEIDPFQTFAERVGKVRLRAFSRHLMSGQGFRTRATGNGITRETPIRV